MNRPRLLDLFCGAGGAAMGYHRAGFDVVGVDVAPQPNYPFEFHQADALDVIDESNRPLAFDVIHASPPCQFATAYRRRKGTFRPAPNLIGAVRNHLIKSRLPYVIENVEQARTWMCSPVRCCGSSFGLDVRRHRLFESNMPLEGSECAHRLQTPRFPPATNRTNLRSTVEIGVWRIPLDVQQRAMGIDWMTREELSQAIPPAYTALLGAQLRRFVNGSVFDASLVKHGTREVSRVVPCRESMP